MILEIRHSALRLLLKKTFNLKYAFQSIFFRLKQIAWITKRTIFWKASEHRADLAGHALFISATLLQEL